MGKRKKGTQPPKLVAPEPPGDEWEANIQWDRISNRGKAPSFFNGAHTAATENVFRVRYDIAATTTSAIDGLQGTRDGLRCGRALDEFLKAEVSFKETVESMNTAKVTLHDFEKLYLAEEEAAKSDNQKFSNEMNAVLRELKSAECELAKEMVRTVGSFYVEQKMVLSRLFDLVAHDHEIEHAFNERMAALIECKRVTEEYHSEHRQHVDTMERMQADTLAMQQAALESMTATLQRTARELTVSSVYQSAKAPADDNRSQLLAELQKLQKQSGGRLRTRADVAQGSTDLQRLVDLERQKHVLAQSRNALLRQQVQQLSEESTSKAVLTAFPAAPSTAMVVRNPLHTPTSLSETALAGDTCERHQRAMLASRDVTNELVQARRQLDIVVRELAAAKERLHHLRRYHLVQLSGNYKPVSLTTDALRTTHNFLDQETNAAVRAAVIDALIEVNDSLQMASRLCSSDGGVLPERNINNPLPNLSLVHSLVEKKSVQNYVVKRINRLFTCMCPTAPPLSLLCDGAL